MVIPPERFLFSIENIFEYKNYKTMFYKYTIKLYFFISLLECRPASIITVYYIKLKTFEFYVEYMLTVLAIFFTLKSLQGLVGSLKSIINKSMFSNWYVFSFIICILQLMQILYKTDHFLSHQSSDPPLWISNTASKQGEWRHKWKQNRV